ncbi:MAG: GspMb/PilO family protein [Pyrinomonadaceae bacterium]|nr:GspMb/PilO family protein [Pyrinomonadaceae bacterium]MCX7638925.1 GspMb/PilO family protein [Pyrinomonadaceae bacterium]MDW8304938.1 GspMb/PilO family protein [Acidobacteriota bacterium]
MKGSLPERRIKKGAFGRLEMFFVSMAGAFFLLAVLFHFFFTVPEKSSLTQITDEKRRLEEELYAESLKYQSYTGTEAQIENLMKSVEDFEMKFLPVADFGRTALYQRLNYLINAYSLVNVSGPEYAPLETGQKTEERGRGKYRSLFPGVYVTMTVEGNYQNLRRFIRELEAGDQFTIITMLELQPSDSDVAQNTMEANTNQALTNQPFSRPADNFSQSQTKPKGKMIGDVISLKVEMVAYFRRMAEVLK